MQANIFISNEGEPLLADFGISQLLIQTNTVANTAELKYSIRWTARELLDYERTDNVTHTFGSDIWAYGMVVYVRFEINTSISFKLIAIYRNFSRKTYRMLICNTMRRLLSLSGRISYRPSQSTFPALGEHLSTFYGICARAVGNQIQLVGRQWAQSWASSRGSHRRIAIACHTSRLFSKACRCRIVITQ